MKWLEIMIASVHAAKMNLRLIKRNIHKFKKKVVRN